MLTLRIRGLIVYHTRVRSALSKSGLPDLDYALNPYLGCGHGCIYCYARLYTRDERASANWGRVVVVKDNIASVLKDEVKRLKPGVVGIGTITDAYQPVEAVYKLTRKCLEILLEAGFSTSIQTKNPLVLRDIDLLSRYISRVDVGFTITTMSNTTAKFIEPGAPPPKARAEALIRLSNMGLKTWVFYGPVIPGVNDDQSTIESLIKLAYEANSIFYYDSLHVKVFMKSPEHKLHSTTYAVTPGWWDRVEITILKLCKEYGLTCKPGFTGDAAT